MKRPVIQVGIQELILAKAGKNGWDKCFHGTVDRKTDKHGEILHGKVNVEGKIIQASARTADELGEKLDELVLVALEGENLFQKAGTGISLN
jgi:hypothetical protein